MIHFSLTISAWSRRNRLSFERFGKCQQPMRAQRYFWRSARSSLVWSRCLIPGGGQLASVPQVGGGPRRRPRARYQALHHLCLRVHTSSTTRTTFDQLFEAPGYRASMRTCLVQALHPSCSTSRCPQPTGARPVRPHLRICVRNIIGEGSFLSTAYLTSFRLGRINALKLVVC